jgi:hypothetical protein
MARYELVFTFNRIQLPSSGAVAFDPSPPIFLPWLSLALDVVKWPRLTFNQSTGNVDTTRTKRTKLRALRLTISSLNDHTESWYQDDRSYIGLLLQFCKSKKLFAAALCIYNGASLTDNRQASEFARSHFHDSRKWCSFIAELKATDKTCRLHCLHSIITLWVP